MTGYSEAVVEFYGISKKRRNEEAMDKIKKLKESFSKLNLTLTEKQYQQFLDYYELLVEWNKVMNLTGITEFDEVVMKHFVDSLSFVYAVSAEKSYKVKVLDMGTGAGFPGIPLKIAFPEMEMVLLDSLNKRIKFLSEVIDKLELENITAIHGRAEEFARKEGYREQFDFCVSRAVANLATLSEYCLPYVKKGGYFIPYKSGTIEEEIETSKKAVGILGGKIKEVKTFVLPESDISRALVIIKKEKETHGKYPRSGGKPAKEPIH